MSKICTDLNQSRKLVELGIDVNTADMMWDDWRLIDDEWKISIGYDPEIEQDYGRKCYPAWSLSALLELVPNGEKNDENYVDTESHSDFYICTYRNCWDGCIHSEYSEENLLDAVFGMICWLNENKKTWSY